MDNEIVSQCANLRIDDEDDEIVDLGAVHSNDAKEKFDLLLIGKLLTERSFNVETFKRTMTSVWNPGHGLIIRVLSPNLFAFQFFHWKDKDRVFLGRPWCFENNLILMK